MSTEPSISREDIPSLARRGVAKAIDFVAVAFTVVGFSSVTHSYLAGLLIGYGWLALSDWGGSLGKWVAKLEVRNHGTGDKWSAWASVVRNLPIIATALPHKLHQAWLGMDRQQYRETHSAVILAGRAMVAKAKADKDAAHNTPGLRQIKVSQLLDCNLRQDVT